MTSERGESETCGFLREEHSRQGAICAKVLREDLLSVFQEE
jgi:hypothetical protein